MALRLSADRTQDRINQVRREQNMEPGLRPTADQTQRNIDQIREDAIRQQMAAGVAGQVQSGTTSSVQPEFSEFDYSDSANYRAALEDVRAESDQEYYDRIYRYSPPSSVTPAQFASPRTLAARRRLQKRRALELLATSAPETLDMFPTLRGIVADVPDLNEEDVRNLINLNQMEAAFQKVYSGNQIVARDVWLSMDPVMQAGFTDYFETRIGQIVQDAQKNPSWFQQGFEWLTNYFIFPTFNALMFLNETWQQATRANAAAIQDSPANAAVYALPGVGLIANTVRYWDSVGAGARDEDRLRLLRAEYGPIVDVFVDLEEKQRDGLGNAYNRWIDDWADTEFSDQVAAVTYRAQENPELISIANKVSMTNRDKIGSLVWGELPEDWLGSQQVQTLSGVTNFGFTVFNDPTIIGSKVLMVARASRYALTKLAGPGGADEAFKYRRTRRIFNDLGRDLSRLERIEDPKKRALARQKIDETYGGQLPADVIQDMSDFGVRNAGDAYNYFKATETATDILEGGPRFTQNELFGRLMSVQEARRTPLLPGRSVVGTIASNARRNAALLNPATKGQVAKTADLLPSDPDDLATVLMGEEYAAAVGIEPRLKSELLQGSKVFGYRYSARGVASRLDRLFRNWAKAPFNMTVDILSGKDAGKIYQWSRAFLPRMHAAAIADAFRGASPGTRKRIIDGLQNASARVRGVQYVSPEDDLLRFSAEARKGRRYSPAIDVKVRGSDGVLRSVDTGQPPNLALGREFNATRQDVDLANVVNQLPDELAGVGSVSVFGRTFDAPDDWVATTFAGVDEVDLPERVAQWGRENGYSVVNYKRSIDVDVQPAWENGPVLYHGTSRPIGRFRPSEEPTEFPVQGFGGTQKFARFEEGVLSGDESQSLYGGIFYATVNRDVGASYKKKKGSRRIDVSDEQGYSYGIMYNVEQEPRLYSVRWTGEAEPRFLDLDMPAPQSLRDYARGAQKFDEFGIADDADEFTARLDELLADPNATGAQILDHIRDGAEAFDNLQSVWVRLADDGWDGYKHIGGRKAGKGKVEHDVYIFFDKNKIAVDAAESSAKETALLPEMVAYGANDPLTKADQILINYAAAGQPVDDIYKATINDQIIPGPVLGESTETRSMSSFTNPMDPTDEIQLPIHKWQARSAVALPNFNEIYEAGVNASVFGATLGWTHHRIAQKIVDFWSLFNLAGPRYYLRNATEDYIVYAMTSGKLASVQKGRRMSAALRETRGGKLRGFNRVRSRKRTVDLDMDVDTASRWSAIKASFSDEDIAKAQAALEVGDVEAVRKIAAIAIGRTRFSGMSGVDTEYFLDYITLHGEKIIDEVAGATTYGSSAASPVAASAAMGAVDDVAKARIIYPGKEFADVPLAGNDPFRFWYWHRNLQGTVDKDGVIGQIAVTNLDKSDDQIVPLIVRALEEDEISKVDNYKELLASLNHPGETYETFARRYIADVRNLFSGKDGQLNMPLWNKIVTTDDQGNRVARMLLKDTDETKFAVEVSDLIEVPNDLLPRNVLGRSKSSEVPVAADFSFFDKWWQVMGDQYAVFSREPIFFANYIEARKMLAPLEKTWNAQFGEEFTRRRLAQIATDRAYLNTLSYTDNPLNRTMLAWNSRNVARYYRATEDFARRMLRVGKNYPQGFWKVALTYDALDETGFVWTDENDQKFFVFPGSDAMVKVLNAAFEVLPGNLRMLEVDSANAELRGMVTMIAPSTDPKQSIPSLSSPLSAIPVQAAMGLFPSLRSFEQALLGEYAENQDWWSGLAPGHIMRLFQSVDPDERQGIYAATIKDSIAIAAAANILPGPDASDEDTKKFLGELQTLATTVLITRIIGGTVLNTTPRFAYNDVTEYARRQGFVDMHGALRQMVDLKAKEGAINPMAEALTQYVETFGADVIPYSMSKYDTGNPWGTYSGRLSPPATEEARIWALENNDLITNEKYQSGAVWLMPRRGEFNGDMYRYWIDMGMKTASTTQEFFEEAQLVKGRWMYYQVKEAQNKRVADAEIKRYQAVLAGDEARVRELTNLIKAYQIDWEGDPDDAFNIGGKAKLEADFPSLNFDKFELAENARPKTLLNEIIPTLKYVLEERDKPAPPIAVNMMQAINTYNMYIVEIESIEGSTRAENNRKYMLRTELTSLLTDIGARDENTQLFVDNILIPMVDTPESYVSLARGRGVL